MRTPSRRTLSRYVAVGDSFTEGLDDMRADGSPRGWADRVADILSVTEPDFSYANLAVRSLRIDAIVAHQVPAAVAMRPDLASFVGGGNDILAIRFDLDRLTQQVDDAVAQLSEVASAVVVFAGFDPRMQLLPGRLFAGRTAAYNERIGEIAGRHAALLIDLWSMPELADARLWSRDRLHLSPAGHLHVAGVVLDRLGRPTPPGWPLRLDQPARGSRLRAVVDEATWSREHLLPWAVRKIRGRAAGDGINPKHTAPVRWAAEPVAATADVNS